MPKAALARPLPTRQTRQKGRLNFLYPSSRFSDGGQLGLGAEIGISTTRLHAYGPMGLESLTIERWVVRGDGQVRHPEVQQPEQAQAA